MKKENLISYLVKSSHLSAKLSYLEILTPAQLAVIFYPQLSQRRHWFVLDFNVVSLLHLNLKRVLQCKSDWDVKPRVDSKAHSQVKIIF